MRSNGSCRWAVLAVLVSSQLLFLVMVGNLCTTAQVMYKMSSSVKTYEDWLDMAQLMPDSLDVYSGKFTVVMPTHHEGIEDAFVVQQWNILREVIDKIIVVWDLPEEKNLKRMQAVLVNNSIPVEFYVNRSTGSLNNRFAPFNQIRTKFVFQLDDDILIRPKGVLAAFETATLNPLKLVSFHGRHRIRRDGLTGKALGYEPHWPKADVESGHLGLTAAGMVATRYMQLYWEPKMGEIRALVDKQRNCEDIAMNYVIEEELRRVSRARGVRVRDVHGGTAIHIYPKLKGMSWAEVHKAVKGVSEHGGHMKKRSLCVQYLENLTSFKLDERKPSPAVNWEPRCLRDETCEKYFPNEIRVDPQTKQWFYPRFTLTRADSLTGFHQPKLRTTLLSLETAG